MNSSVGSSFRTDLDHYKNAVTDSLFSLSQAIENGELNGLTAPKYEIRLGDLARDVDGKYPVIAANIVADAIIMLSPAIPALLAEDGVYIVSGIIDTREADVLPALAACGFKVEARYESRGWLCFVCRPE